MPWVSDAQRRWGNSPAGRRALGASGVKEWNRATKGRKLPERVKHKKVSVSLPDGHKPKSIKVKVKFKKKSTAPWKFLRRVNNKQRSFGVTDLDKKTITINKRMSKRHKKGGTPELLDTIVHEETHARHPRMNEQTVRRRTKRAIKRMPKRAKKAAYNRFR